MASNAPPSSSAENATMGNTQVGIAGGNVSFSQRDQIPTAVQVAQAHNVQVASTSSGAVLSANSEQKSNNATGLFSQPEHKSSDESHASFSAANAANDSSWADQEDEPMVEEDEQQIIPVEKVPTPPHSFSSTKLSFPPYPPRDEIPKTDPNGTVLMFSIDIRSPGARYAMDISRANNEGMLLKIMHKFSTIANEPFSPSTILPGLKKHQIDVLFPMKNRKSWKKKCNIKTQQQQQQPPPPLPPLL